MGVMVHLIRKLYGNAEMQFFYAVLAASGVLYGLHEMKLVRLWYPEARRQVQAHWRYRFPKTVTAFLFGLQLGAGYLTFLPAATLHLVGLAAVLSASPLHGVAMFLSFAGARAGSFFILSSRAKTTTAANTISGTLIVTKPLAHLINGWALLVGGGFALQGLFSGLV